MESLSYVDQTYANVVASDGTIIFGNPYSPGSREAIKAAIAQGKPHIINPTPQELRGWMEQHHVKVLNVAGNRFSTNPRIVDIVTKALIEAFQEGTAS
jgi:hypothetical protein